MREIKFRQPIFNKGKFSHLHYWGFISAGHFAGVVGDLDTAHKTSQQYTGLLDKSGKEIYDGDIVTGVCVGGDDYRGNHTIFFYGGCFCIDIKQGISGKYDYAPCLDEAWMEKLEVIGNIYQTPELLEGL